MCGLCGAFGVAEHWTDGSASRAEAQRRVLVGNRFLAPYGLRLAEWSGRFTLSARTGGSAVVDNFGALWPAAERLAGRPCDPLDDAAILWAEAQGRR
jgi:hypothetical protein